mmetsp:Transcript_49661/g.112785  ORF Transcript_49661/g.112785 Transcript_49661/m.112785 type:complete len:298 (+) Transcript_49661:318-1211(+)
MLGHFAPGVIVSTRHHTPPLDTLRSRRVLVIHRPLSLALAKGEVVLLKLLELGFIRRRFLLRLLHHSGRGHCGCPCSGLRSVRRSGSSAAGRPIISPVPTVHHVGTAGVTWFHLTPLVLRGLLQAPALGSLRGVGVLPLHRPRFFAKARLQLVMNRSWRGCGCHRCLRGLRKRVTPSRTATAIFGPTGQSRRRSGHLGALRRINLLGLGCDGAVDCDVHFSRHTLGDPRNGGIQNVQVQSGNRCFAGRKPGVVKTPSFPVVGQHALDQLRGPPFLASVVLTLLDASVFVGSIGGGVR